MDLNYLSKYEPGIIITVFLLTALVCIIASMLVTLIIESEKKTTYNPGVIPVVFLLIFICLLDFFVIRISIDRSNRISEQQKYINENCVLMEMKLEKETWKCGDALIVINK